MYVYYSDYYKQDFMSTNKDVPERTKYDSYATSCPDYECEQCNQDGFPCLNCTVHVYNSFKKNSWVNVVQKKNKEILVDYKTILNGKRWADVEE